MFDMHYDLLSRLYYDYIKYGYVSNDTKEDLKKIYSKDNMIGGFINLYFMSYDEMYEEAGINKEDINVLEMFKKSIELLDDLKKEGIFDSNTKFIFSIEGCDYIKDENELEELYNLGLRSILLVWNNKNKYGSGNRSNEGLSELGQKFIRHAIELGIVIDVSHANKNTFYGILDVVKDSYDKGFFPILIASHSNVYELCNHSRNLDYEQLVALKNMNGYIGVVGYNPFVGDSNFKDRYIEHIKYLIEVVGFIPNKILLSTDNMNFIDVGNNTFDIHNIDELKNLLLNYYDNDVVDSIMYKNALDIVRRLNN